MDFDLNLRNLQENNEFYEKVTQEWGLFSSVDNKYSNISVLESKAQSEFIDEEQFQPSPLSNSKNADFWIVDAAKPEEKNQNFRKTSIASIDDSNILVEFKVD